MSIDSMPSDPVTEAGDPTTTTASSRTIRPELQRSLACANRAFGPIAAGIIVDFVDFITFGPIGLILGLPVGGLAGYWMGSCLRLSPRTCWLCAVTAGVYCTVPFTELLPLATLVGAYARYQEELSRHEERDGSPQPDALVDSQRSDSPSDAAPEVGNSD